jgi:hypothetical protein
MGVYSFTGIKQAKTMSNCCSGDCSKTAAQACPECDVACKSVEMRTLYHQVSFPENQKITPGHYFFCSTKECPVGYFSTTGIIIPKRQLRSYLEIQQDKLCYCFDIDAASYLSALSANKSEAIKGFVIQRTKSGECACQIRNPSGLCCLAQFKYFEKMQRKQGQA